MKSCWTLVVPRLTKRKGAGPVWGTAGSCGSATPVYTNLDCGVLLLSLIPYSLPDQQPSEQVRHALVHLAQSDHTFHRLVFLSEQNLGCRAPVSNT